MGLIQIEKITIDARLQYREDSRGQPDCANPARAQEYREKLDGGAAFAPVKIIREGETLWLYDGFTTVAAQKLRGKLKVMAEVVPGDFAKALRLSWAANSDHGQPRSAVDGLNVARSMVATDPSWMEKSGVEWARATGMTERWCRQLRADLAAAGEAPAARPASAAAANGEAAANGTANANGTNGEAAANGAAAPKRKRGRPPGAGQTNGRRRRRPAAGGEVRDGLQNPVPERLRDIFAADPLTEAAQFVRRAISTTRACAAWNNSLPVGRVVTALEQAEAMLTGAAPFCVCPDCGGEGCPPCGTKGWLTVAEHNSVGGASHAG